MENLKLTMMDILENIIGHIDLYQYFHTEESLETAILCWNYVAKHLLDGKNGEWHWAVWNLLSVNINTTFVIESNVWRFYLQAFFMICKNSICFFYFYHIHLFG